MPVSGPRPARPGTPRRRRPALGLLLLAAGRADGLAQFGTDTDAYLGSLAPLLGLFIVTGLLVAVGSGPMRGGLFFLIMLCNLLAPPVIGHAFCQWWKRLDRWPLYANVLNWSAWLMVCVGIVLLPFARMTLAFGLTPVAAAGLLVACMFVYMLWFQWFLARNALALSRARALLVMAAVVFGTGLLLQLPIWVGEATGLQAAPDLSMPVPGDTPDRGSGPKGSGT